MSALSDMFKKTFKSQNIVSRLKNTQLKLKQVMANKTEEKNKLKKEIVDCITSGNTERAKIKVIQVIREDNRVYAMEFLESHCGLLYQQAGLIESSRNVDKNLAEAVSTLIWASPRFQTEIPELKEVATLLGIRYGKDYVERCRANRNGTVNQTVIKKLEVELPPSYMVEKYLAEIALESKKLYIPKEAIPVETAADANAALHNIYGEVQFQDGAAGAGSISEEIYEIPDSEERNDHLYLHSGYETYQPRNRPDPPSELCRSNMPLPQPRLPVPHSIYITPSNYAPLARQQLQRQNQQIGNPARMLRPAFKINMAASRENINNEDNNYEDVE